MKKLSKCCLFAKDSIINIPDRVKNPQYFLVNIINQMVNGLPEVFQNSKFFRLLLLCEYIYHTVCNTPAVSKL